MPNLLSQKAVLAAVKISQWSARRLDRKVTDETNNRHKATADAGRYNKLLIDKSALAPIQTVVSQARAYHLTMTQPWVDQGPRLLPSVLCIDYTNRLRELRRDFDQAAETFTLAFPDLVADRKKKLNGMFRQQDYPKAKDIRGRFDFDVELFNVPETSDFRVDIAEEHAADLRASIEASMQKALRGAMKDAAERVLETVGHMASRLRAFKPATEDDGAEGVFRDSLVENVRELSRLLPAFNLTEDPALTKIAERIQSDLCEFDAPTLRENEKTRHKVAAAAEAILADVAGFIA